MSVRPVEKTSRPARPVVRKTMSVRAAEKKTRASVRNVEKKKTVSARNALLILKTTPTPVLSKKRIAPSAINSIINY